MTAKWAKGTGGPSGDEDQNLVLVPEPVAFRKMHAASTSEDEETWEEADEAGTLALQPVNMPGRTLVLLPDTPSTSPSEASPVRTSASPDDDAASETATDPSCSSSSPVSQTNLYDPEATSYLRTFPDSWPHTTDEISPWFSRRWPSSGFTTSLGECWTADTSEYPNGGGASSSLRDVLEAEAPETYYLSRKAAAGILRRASRRGRVMPRLLERALKRLAGDYTPPPGSRGGDPSEGTLF